jgi:general secretion pathway protein A
VYESFYGLKEKPFSLTPDPKYLYLSPRHSEAFAHLEFGRREKGGFVVITGEVGTGKTTLARYFLSRLHEKTRTAVVLYPALTAVELLRSILADLKVESRGESLKDHVDALHGFLLEARGRDEDVVLLIDESQDLSPEVLEQIRLLSNLETDTEKLIQIVLLGQSELNLVLAGHSLRQLAQRITARYHLSPLDPAEVAGYIEHRLKVAGGEGKVAFTPGAIRRVARRSGGIPRIINLVCDRALLAGYVSGERTISTSLVARASREVEGAPRHRVPLLALTLAVGLAAVGFFWPPGAPEPAPPPSPVPSPEARIDSLVLGLGKDASLEGSLVRLQGLWGGASLERASFRTTLDQVRQLNLPVVLEMFHPARKDTCFLALLGLDGEAAEVAWGNALQRRVPLRELDRLWTRNAVFLFPAPATAPDEWARLTLARLGYTEEDLAVAVGRFQRESDLEADGIVGSRTLLALFVRSAEPRPQLGVLGP